MADDHVKKDESENNSDLQNLTHAHFLECMERVDQAICGTQDLTQMLRDVMDTVRGIFKSDRAWLMCPCDPEAKTYRVPMESAAPEYPGAMVLNLDVPITPGAISHILDALQADGPVSYGSGKAKPVERETAERFSVRSQIIMAIYPKVGKPWLFGMHQCSRQRAWSNDEQRLFKEIGRRIADGLSSMLTLRDLQQSEDRYKALLSKLPGAAYRCKNDPDWTMEDISDAIEDIAGYSASDIINNRTITYASIIHPDDQQTVWNSIQNAISSGQPFYIEYRILHKNGQCKWINEIGRGVKSQDGGLACLEGAIFDITDSKQSEEDLRKSEQRYSLAQRAANIGSWDWNILTNELEWSDQIEPMFGFKPGQFEKTYEAFMRCVHPDDRDFVEESVRTAVEGPKEYSVEHRIVWQDGSIHWMSEDGQVLRDDMGRPIRMLGVAQDITERKKAQEEHTKMEEQVAHLRKMEAIGQLAGGVAHDFNNLLTAIIGNAELLKMHIVPNTPETRYVEQVEIAANRAAELTKQLLVFSRKDKLQTSRVDINQCVRETIQLLNRSLDKSIEIEESLQAAPAFINGDPTLLQNAILNLAVNARDAMPKGGKLIFATRNLTLDQDFCYTVADEISPGAYIEIEVSDSGVGMSEAVQKHIFEPFYTTKAVGKGTGLGLAGVYGCVRSHHGLIRVYSELGKGSTFKLILPASKSEADREDAAVPDTYVRGKGRILVVDDEKLVREFAVETLRSFGYTVYSCCDGVEALELFAKQKEEIDLVILDMIMPKKSGEQVFFQMKAMKPDVRVLVCSGFARGAGVNAVLRQGAVGFLSKPFQVAELSREVDRCIRGNN